MLHFQNLLKVILPACFILLASFANAQYAFNSTHPVHLLSAPYNNAINNDNGHKRKLFQRNYGVIGGIQRGRYTSIELGGEAHWRKISLLKPHIIGATANMEYNFSENVAGYKAGLWIKRGRINFTYGANVGYYTNFKEGNRLGFGPSIGFRLLGLHLVNGYTFLTKDNTTAGETSLPVNNLYMSLRYYIPVENKFTWDRHTMKRKKERRKAREEKKEQRKKERESGEKTGLRKLFGSGGDEKKKSSKKEKEEEEKKGLRKLFNFGNR